MKASALCPLEQVSCCRDVPDYHAPVKPSVGSELHPGDVLDERFLITEMISRSGMAMIYKAQDLHNQNVSVAVKVPHFECESDPGFFTRFRREEQIGCSLNHPYLLKFIRLTLPKSRPYIVTEYLRGCTLAHLLDRMCPLPEKDALKIASLLCEALEYLHNEGVIHRDLKPQNVMIGCDGTIRLLDFGLAVAADSRRVTFHGLTPAMGTPDFMAPEQVKGKRGDERTDIYSLGAMLYLMLTGKLPFEGDNALAAMNARVLGDPEPIRKANPNVSPQVEEIVLHAMERDPRNRYTSVDAMQAELENLDLVRVSGRAERLHAPAIWKQGFRQYRVAVLSLLIPVLVPVAVALYLLLHHRSAVP